MKTQVIASREVSNCSESKLVLHTDLEMIISVILWTV
jgi:hypothetical protein